MDLLFPLLLLLLKRVEEEMEEESKKKMRHQTDFFRLGRLRKGNLVFFAVGSSVDISPPPLQLSTNSSF